MSSIYPKDDNKPEIEKILKTALKAAERAKEIAVNVRKSGQISLKYKGEVNLCTIADVEAEKAIIETIKTDFPQHKFLAEESSSELEGRDFSGDLWIIDPIDGTTNYAHGHNHVGISLAYARDGQVLAGVVAVPFQNELFWATKGRGAFLNGQKISCSTTGEIKSALVCTGFPYERSDITHLLSRFAAVLKDCRDMRRLGACSVDICWVACGRLDLYYEDVMPWDMAAATLIAKEAGAEVSHFEAEASSLPHDLRSDGLIVSNPELMAIFKDKFGRSISN